MSAILYDNALINKLKKWTEKADVQIYGPSDQYRIFQINADKSNDKSFKLPAIVLSRNGYSIDNISKRPMVWDGKKIEADENKVKQINAIPVKLDYNIEVYARYYDEADSYMREIIFNVINYPRLDIDIPYLGFNTIHASNIRISSSSIEDNKQGGLLSFNDQICSLKLQINIDDAYLWDSRVRTTVSIEGDGLTVNPVNPDNSEDSEPIVID